MAVKPLVLSAISFVLCCMALPSCDNVQSSEDILDDFVQYVNNSKDGDNNYIAINTTNYFAICFSIENTPTNKAKLLLLGNNTTLQSQFRESVLKNLRKEKVLTQIVKDKKGFAYAILSGDIEYHVYFPPEELYTNIFK